MRGVNKGRAADVKWLQDLGKHIDLLIKRKGYTSAYDFWVNKAGDHISRATLNYILAGKSDPKATTLRTIAKLLGVSEATLFEF